MKVEKSRLFNHPIIDILVLGEGFHCWEVFSGFVAADSHNQVDQIALADYEVGDVANIAVGVDCEKHVHTAPHTREEVEGRDELEDVRGVFYSDGFVDLDGGG